MKKKQLESNSHTSNPQIYKQKKNTIWSIHQLKKNKYIVINCIIEGFYHESFDSDLSPKWNIKDFIYEFF